MALDFFGVRAECGCISAWMSAAHSSEKDVREFYKSMADTGREVRRMEFTEELRGKIDRCTHYTPPPPKPVNRLRYRRVGGRNVSRVSVVVPRWPRGIGAGEVAKRDKQWWATAGWFSTQDNTATDGKDPRGPSPVFGPFKTQREAAERLIPLAEKYAEELSAEIDRGRVAA